MLVLTLIARTTLLSPSAGHPLRPDGIAFRFMRHRAASCPVSASNADIPAAMSPVTVLREYNIQKRG